VGQSFFLSGFSTVFNSAILNCVVSLACRACRLFLLYSDAYFYEICRNLRDLYYAEITLSSEVTGSRDKSEEKKQAA